jgi:hypothetical protein
MKNILGWSLLAVSVGMAGCNADKPTERPEAGEKVLPVTRIAARDTVLLHEYVGDIQAVRNVEIRARVPGFLDKIYVDEGRRSARASPCSASTTKSTGPNSPRPGPTAKAPLPKPKLPNSNWTACGCWSIKR